MGTLYPVSHFWQFFPAFLWQSWRHLATVFNPVRYWHFVDVYSLNLFIYMYLYLYICTVMQCFFQHGSFKQFLQKLENTAGERDSTPEHPRQFKHYWCCTHPFSVVLSLQTVEDVLFLLQFLLQRLQATVQLGNWSSVHLHLSSLPSTHH